MKHSLALSSWPRARAMRPLLFQASPYWGANWRARSHWTSAVTRSPAPMYLAHSSEASTARWCGGGVCRQAAVPLRKITVKWRFILDLASVRCAPFMRKTRFGLALVVALLGGAEANAQFANRRIGFELGGLRFDDR